MKTPSPTQKSGSILVTGAAGFIGARLSRILTEQNETVLGSDRLESFESRACCQGIPFSKKIDRMALFDWLEEKVANSNGRAGASQKPIRAIYHLGARTDTTGTDAAIFQELNLDYSKKIWDFCAKNQIPLVYASSAATYGAGIAGSTGRDSGNDLQEFQDDETAFSHLRPLNLYGQSKLDFDIWALEQERRGWQPPQWSGFKFFNVYGWGEQHKGFMSSVVYRSYQRLSENPSRPIELFRSEHSQFKDGEQKRDFVFVDDLVEVLQFAMNQPLKRGIYNLGTGHARSWIDLARAIFASMKLEENIRFVEMPDILKGKYQYFTQASMAKLRQAGYQKPFRSLEAGVAETIRQLQAKS